MPPASRFGMSDIRERIAWAGGLYDGEGSAGSYERGKRPDGSPRFHPQVSLAMTDEDSVLRFQEIVGVGKVGWETRPPHKPLYRWKVSSFEEAQAVAALLWPFVCKRRQGQFRQMLTTMAADRLKNEAHRDTCRRGHLYTPANTAIRPQTGSRRCRQCTRESSRRTYWKNVRESSST